MIKGVHAFYNEFPSPQMEKLIRLPIATFDSDDQDRNPMIRYSVVQPIESIGREAVQVFLAEHPSTEGIIKKIPAEIKMFSVE